MTTRGILYIELQSVIPPLANGNPSDWFLCPFEMTNRPPGTRCSRLTKDIFPGPGATHFSKDLWIFLVGNDI